MLIALHRLKQLGKQKLAKIWLQMSNQSETQTGRRSHGVAVSLC